MRDFAALGCTDRVVSQIAHQAEELLGLTASSAGLALKLLNRDDLANIQCSSQIADLIINAATVHITGEKHHIHQMRGAVEIGSAGALVLLASIQQRLDHSFRINVILAEVGGGISALKRGSHTSDVHVSMNGVKLIILPDRTDLVFRNLPISANITTVTDHDSSGEFFVQVHAVNVVEILHDIEILNVDDVITIDLALNVNSLGISRSVDQLEVSDFALQGALRITLGAQLFDVTEISLTGTDARDRALMNLLQNLLDPALVSREHFRCARTNILVVREQLADVLNAMRQNTVRILFSKQIHCMLQAADSAGLGHVNDCGLIGVREDVRLILPIVVKDIVLHSVVLLVVISIFGFFAGSDTFGNQRKQNILLFLRHRIQDVLHGFFIVFLVLFRRICLFFISMLQFSIFGILITIGMGKLNIIFVQHKQDLGFLSCLVIMLHDRINIRTGVRPGQNETQLTNHAVNHIRPILYKVVCPNGQCTHIAIIDQLLTGTTRVSVIEIAIGIYAICSIFEIGMPENIRDTVVLMPPTERHFRAVLIFKSIRHDHTLISACEIGFRSIAMKVTIRVFQFHT